MIRRAARLAAGLGAAAALAVQAGEPPRVGLVLGGGGARGAAHLGVLEVLEQLRVPVHCVAGTSMGALVAGAWAAGVSPERMRGELTVADWNDIFQDSPDYRDLSLRNKHIVQRFLPGSELGFSRQGVTAPPGVVAGQKIKLFLNQLVRADLGEPDLAELALPVAIVATDIGTGERVLFRSGSLTQAMRASMSVPGLMAPAEVQGRKLVDGGLVDNLPVSEVRALCNPDVVIAVNVGTPLLPAESVGSLLSVTAQMVAILTEQNVTRSIQALRPEDIYLRPDLDGIGAADFERHDDAAERGRAAARAQAARLSALALPAEAYAAWHARFMRGSQPPPVVDAIEIAGLERVQPGAVRRHIRQPVGERLDSLRLNRDLVRAYGEGHFDGVDYSLVREGARHVLRILPHEKPWGPDYLRMALSLSTTLSQGSTYSLRAAWHRTWLNRWGGELLVSGEIGSASGLGAEVYQPLGDSSPWFVDASASYRRERLDLWSSDDRVAEFLLERSQLVLAAGVDVSHLGQLRIGWQGTQWRPSLDTGAPVFDTPLERRGAVFVSLELDRQGRQYFPSDGWALRASWVDGGDYARARVEWRQAWSFGASVLAGRFSWVGSPRGELPPFDAASLGGFLNLSGYAAGQVAGDSARYGHLRAERIVGNLPLGLRGDLRFGLALEAGQVGRPLVPTRHDGLLHSLTLYLGGETPLGPVYLGAGHSFSGATNAYLFIGTP